MTATGSDSHCSTCLCGSPDNLDALNRRCVKLAQTQAAFVVQDLPRAVVARLTPHAALYVFGFSGFKLTAESDKAVGQFLCALLPAGHTELDSSEMRRQTRYFYVTTRSPYWFDDETATQPTCVEYSAGEEFDTSGDLPSLADLEGMMRWSDEGVSRYLNRHLLELRRGVEQAVLSPTEYELLQLGELRGSRLS